MLESDTQKATAGYFQLHWEVSEPEQSMDYIVEEKLAGEPDEILVYQVSDTAMAMSGKPDGTYLYTVRSADNRYNSNQVEVVVAHHSLASAFQFFTMGAIVFVVLLVTILGGNKRARLE